MIFYFVGALIVVVLLKFFSLEAVSVVFLCGGILWLLSTRIKGG